MSSQLSPGDIRAAAEVHRELGPEYSDAVVESFLARVDRQIAERVDREVDARLRAASQPAPVQPATVQPAPAQLAPSSSRHTLLAGVAIGIFATGVPSVMIAASGGSTLAKDETQLLVAIAVIWALVFAVIAFARRPRGDGTTTHR